MKALMCCEDRPFCTHMPLMVTLLDTPDAANEASSPPRAGARSIRRAGVLFDALSTSGRRGDAGAPREVS
jgi:hypothetical protein